MSEENATTKDAPIAFAIAVKYVQKHQPEHMQAGEQFDMTTFSVAAILSSRDRYKEVLFLCGGKVSNSLANFSNGRH